MKRKTFAIIGGGFSGCTAALYLLGKGHKISIYEKHNMLGGVAKDLLYNENIYFRGPNYLKSESLLIKLLQKEKLFTKNIKEFDLLYGSYTDIFGEKNVSNIFAHPVSSSNFEVKNKISPKIINLRDRIEYYPPNVSNDLILWTEKYGNNLSNLHHECSHAMGFGRLHFKNCDKEIYQFKKKSKIADDLLGIPNLNYNKSKYCIPKKGYNSFFTLLKDFL